MSPFAQFCEQFFVRGNGLLQQHAASDGVRRVKVASRGIDQTVPLGKAERFIVMAVVLGVTVVNFRRFEVCGILQGDERTEGVRLSEHPVMLFAERGNFFQTHCKKIIRVR